MENRLSQEQLSQLYMANSGYAMSVPVFFGNSVNGIPVRSPIPTQPPVLPFDPEAYQYFCVAVPSAKTLSSSSRAQGKISQIPLMKRMMPVSFIPPQQYPYTNYIGHHEPVILQSPTKHIPPVNNLHITPTSSHQIVVKEEVDQSHNALGLHIGQAQEASAEETPGLVSLNSPSLNGNLGHTGTSRLPETSLVLPCKEQIQESNCVNEQRGNNIVVLKGLNADSRFIKGSDNEPQIRKKDTKKRNEFQPAFRYRNVYKSIVRYVHNYAVDNEEKLVQLLNKEGFDEKAIKGAFAVIKKFKSDDSPKEIEKKAKIRVDEMLKTKSPGTFILRETLNFMMDKWKNKEYGQLHENNIAVYIEACKLFLEQTESLIGCRV